MPGSMSEGSLRLRGWLGGLADHRDPRSLAARLRGRRMQLLRSLLAGLPRPLTILDVGGSEGLWSQLPGDDALGVRIVLLNRSLPHVTRPGFEAVTGDARRLDNFRDGEFDLAFSNSVIEHVGDWRDQQAMARELRRVGRGCFVQTPSFWFPIEPHFLVPGFQFLPLALRVALVRRFALGWRARVPDAGAARELVLAHRLLSARQMRALFPDAELIRERVLGLTKSLVAWRSPRHR
jgi:hypothetical protein